MFETKITLRKEFFTDKEQLLVEHGALSVSTFRYSTGVEGLTLRGRHGYITVLPYKGHQIWRAEFLDHPMVMKTLFDEPQQTDEFLKTYGAFLIHCGLTAIGNPSAEDTHPLHGELPNARYQKSFVIVGEDERGKYIELQGQFQYCIGFEVGYRFIPTYRLYEDDTHFHVKNRIVNLRGVEQEYFLVREEDYQKRIDLKLCGRTLFGAKPPKGQEMEDHYYGNIKMKVADFMADLDKELWKYGIPAKTKHNEAAPSQHEIACIYRDVNITTDNNQLLMSVIQDVAKKHGLHCLLHEKPYAYINGSGKHNNYSLLTDTGVNIFNPGPNPESNIPFLAAVACMVKGVDEFADLLRVSTASATNDLRLGGNEAPPAIVSMFLGEDISDLFTGLTSGNFKPANKERFHTGVKVSSDFSKDATDRNRTSPLAFTGNKFEFRMVGSNQCVAGPNTMLNAILAYEAKKMTQAIKDGGQVMDVILSFYNEHKRIVFNGDGYSDMWRNEALKRDLKERQNTYEAAFAYLDAPNVAMLTEMGIYTEEELKSRFEIILENYAKTVRIEASTALLMAKTEIYPAVLNELKDKSELLNNLHNLSINDSYIFDDLQNYNALIVALKADIDSLQADLNKYNELTSINDKAAFAVEKLNKDLAQIRNSVDLLEDETAKNKWPIPNYVDLIFAL